MTDERALAGPNICLLGEGGVGKTYILSTMAEWCQKNGKEMFVLFTENSLETLLGVWRDAGKEVPSCLHWHQATTRAVGLKQLVEGAKKVGELTYEMLTKTADTSRSGDNNAFWKLLTACSDFPDDRTGKKFGPVDGFKTDKVFALDSFTELGNAAAKMVIGSKPTMAPPEYGVAQNNTMNFLRLLTQAMEATFVMTAHPTREKDEISGAVKTLINTGGIGTAIIPQIYPLFSDVIWAYRAEGKFLWATDSYGVTTKTRSLGYKANITPDFAGIMDLWKGRGGK